MPISFVVAAVVLAAVAGVLVGGLTRWWLGRLGRGARVPWPWCEAGVGLVWGAVTVGWLAGAVAGAAVPLLLGLGWLAVAGSAVDVVVRRLPDALTLPAVPLVLVLLALMGGAAVLRGAVGALVLCGAHAVVRLVAPTAMGGGDVKLAAPVGAAMGGTSWFALAVGAVFAAFITALAGAVRSLLATRREIPAASTAAPSGGTTSGAPAGVAAGGVPHGPSMLLACLCMVGIASVGPAVPVPAVEPASSPTVVTGTLGHPGWRWSVLGPAGATIRSGSGSGSLVDAQLRPARMVGAGTDLGKAG